MSFSSFELMSFERLRKICVSECAVTVSGFPISAIVVMQIQLGSHLKVFIIHIYRHCNHRLNVRSTWDPTTYPMTLLVQSHGFAFMKHYITWSISVWSLFCFIAIVNTLVHSVLHSCFACTVFQLSCGVPFYLVQRQWLSCINIRNPSIHSECGFAYTV